ncbi:MAG: hypothetical protein ACRDPY_50885 [Streptosporangiaceae bacterium]
MRVILLGPQRRPTVDAAVRLLGAAVRLLGAAVLDGPLATVTAGWQEREADDQELGAPPGTRVLAEDGRMASLAAA